MTIEQYDTILREISQKSLDPAYRDRYKDLNDFLSSPLFNEASINIIVNIFLAQGLTVYTFDPELISVIKILMMTMFICGYTTKTEEYTKNKEVEELSKMWEEPNLHDE